jgi:diacylglycerol kinase family enzyme
MSKNNELEGVKVELIAVLAQLTDGTCRLVMLDENTSELIAHLIADLYDGKIPISDEVLENISIERAQKQNTQSRLDIN